MDESIVRRFWEHVKPGEETDCWPWLSEGEIPKGYGKLFCRRPDGSRYVLRGHRISYLLHKGAIPDGLVVRHACDNPPCCNPAHLLIGTKADNARDMVERGRSNKPAGMRHPRRVLSETQVAEIRRRYVTMRQLAQEYGVAISTISGVIHGATWR